MGEQIWIEYLQASSQSGSSKESELRDRQLETSRETVRTGDVSLCETLRNLRLLGSDGPERVDGSQGFINEGRSVSRPN